MSEETIDTKARSNGAVEKEAALRHLNRKLKWQH
jgi:hypothetical protein